MPKQLTARPTAIARDKAKGMKSPALEKKYGVCRTTIYLACSSPEGRKILEELPRIHLAQARASASELIDMTQAQGRHADITKDTQLKAIDLQSRIIGLATSHTPPAMAALLHVEGNVVIAPVVMTLLSEHLRQSMGRLLPETGK